MTSAESKTGCIDSRRVIISRRRMVWHIPGCPGVEGFAAASPDAIQGGCYTARTMQPGATTTDWETLAIVGVGLIGGSLGAAVKQRRLAQRVIGVGRHPERLKEAQRRGLIDETEGDLGRAAARASFLVFCTPVDQIAAQVRLAQAHAQPGTCCTDAGSVKGALCAALADLASGPCVFVGAHPLAGSEKSGFEHANPQLFQERTCVLTPLPEHDPQSVERVEQFWRGVGMRVRRMTPQAHDAALAWTSHVPHVVAAALAAALRDEHRSLTATGFRDTTRIAAGDPQLWTAILLQNAEAVLAALDGVAQELSAFRAAIAHRDAAALNSLLQTAKTHRDALGNGGSGS
jgi:prephenate dehydrogenase